MKYDVVIVGAGLSGCILAERLASKFNEKILIIERRQHIAGNCYDYRDENNILIQKYGPHIFHTNSPAAWNYISQFTEWENYMHKVLAYIDGEFVPVPFNLNSLSQCFPKQLSERIQSKLLEKYQLGTKIPIMQMRQENDDKDFKMLADFIYEKVFYTYTIKQWGLAPEKLAPSVTARIPFFISRDNRYFQDTFQGIPRFGYTKMMEKMIDNPNIHLMLNADFFDMKDKIDYKKLIYTGAIDSFFDCKFGHLPYRDLHFKLEKYDLASYQEAAQINYPTNYEFTRITEFAHFYKTAHLGTVIAKEFPVPHVPEQKSSPYYPIPTAENDALAQKYLDGLRQIPDVIAFGRLADYKYYNMDQAVLRALEVFSKIEKEK